MTHPFGNAFADRRVLVTGHTGFKGSWLTYWLSELGARLYGYSLPREGRPSLFAAAGLRSRLVENIEGDVSDVRWLADLVGRVSPDLIIHLAAQSLVLESYRRPLETFATNVMGTASVLDAVRQHSRPCAVLIVTSDKCYANTEQECGYRESDPLGGSDPYSASKGSAELVTAAYRSSFFHPGRLASHGVQIASARGGNVIGGGDWAADRIVPDIVRAATSGKPLEVRFPQAVRPWQHVLDVLNGYLSLAACMLTRPHARWCSAWNFGPSPGPAVSVSELVQRFQKVWGAGEWKESRAEQPPKETAMLRLSIDKALAALPWQPRWPARVAIERAANWYREFHHGESALELCRRDLAAFSESAGGVLCQS